MNAREEEILEKNYINWMIQFFHEIIYDKQMGFSCIETHEMINYLTTLERLLFGKDKSGNMVMYVICNDLFAWACADAEEVTYDEIPDLFWMSLKDPQFGAEKWCCKKRNLKPQTAFIKIIEKENLWEDWMNDLDDSIM